MTRVPGNAYYQTPFFKGFSLAASAQLENDAAALARNKSAALMYEDGTLSVLAGVETNTQRDRWRFLGVAAQWGQAKIMASAAQVDLQGKPSENSYVLSGTYDFPAGFAARAGYGRSVEQDIGKASLGVIKRFSKTFMVYLDVYDQSALVDARKFQGAALGMTKRF